MNPLPAPARVLPPMHQRNKYTCNDYRDEMRLIGLRKRLNEDDLSPTERQLIEAEIARLEKALQLN